MFDFWQFHLHSRVGGRNKGGSPGQFTAGKQTKVLIKYMKWPPTIFHERNYTVVRQVPQHQYISVCVEFIYVPFLPTRFYFILFISGVVSLTKQSHSLPNYKITHLSLTQLEKQGSIIDVKTAGGV